MIRYRGGSQVRTAGRDTWANIITLAGALSGTFVLYKPARMKRKFPVDVEESVDENLPIQTEILWKLGDPPLPAVFRKSHSIDPDFRAPHGETPDIILTTFPIVHEASPATRRVPHH